MPFKNGRFKVTKSWQVLQFVLICSHIMKNISRNLLCGFVALGAALSCDAVPVTFQCDMDHQINVLGYFTPGVDRVEVRGPVTGWGPGLELTNVAGTTLYQNTYDYTATPGSRQDYKFWHSGRESTTSTGNSWESDVNRFFNLSDAPQIVTRYFNDRYEGGEPVAVAFQVNMGVRLRNGSFDPLLEIVEVRGTFQEWVSGSMLQQSATDTNIYEGTFLVANTPTNNFIQYKFWSKNWESGDNRILLLTNTVMTAPIDYFNREVPNAVPVTFQVDMGLAAGFAPETDAVEVRGSFQPEQWSPGFTLTNIPGSPIYSGAINVPRLPGTTFDYKFLFVSTSQQDRYENGENRTFVLSSTAQVLPLERFNRISNTNDVLPADTLVQFQVNMSAATNSPLLGRAIPFAPENMTVYVNGDFLGWWDWNLPPAQYELFEAGPGTLIYTNTLLVAKGSLVALTYKYGVSTYAVDANSNTDNEAGANNNHVRYVRTVGGTTVFEDVFGVMEVEPLVGSLAIGQPFGGNVPLAWRGRPGVSLQTSTNLTDWSDVPGTYAASSASLPFGTGPGFYRLVKP